MISLLQENLIKGFMALGLTRAEAEIAAAGSGQNPSNRNCGTQSDRDFFASIMEPVGRNR